MVDIRGFLQQIKKSNDLFTVKKKVSVKYEIATVTEKLDGSKAALFENVQGSKFKLVSNLVGSRDRFAQAIGCKKSEINQKIKPRSTSVPTGITNPDEPVMLVKATLFPIASSIDE
ncbi:3-octaprenyl-4-hydroxybenzoate carboxy-lyase protein [Marine Group I thaumarchaeote SCGC AAA799-D07]|nr:3-octaprenyl-4-hydroxybenzoate carboxy-lyase protein [Marine Group I thaumarchaeote SCGC AAA799-D07]